MNEYSNLPKTSSEAISAGQYLFFSGEACKHGHISSRRVHVRNGQITTRCEQCRELSQNLYKSKADYSEKRSKVSKNWRDKNPSYGKDWRSSRKEERPFYTVINSIRNRSAQRGIPFDIDEEYISSIFPEDNLCPILREPMIVGGGGNKRAWFSVDRIMPAKGYVRGNVAIISIAANAMKQDCTDPMIFRRLADWLETAQSQSVTDDPTLR